MRVVVAGAGSIGSLLAAHLAGRRRHGPDATGGARRRLLRVRDHGEARRDAVRRVEHWKAIKVQELFAEHVVPVIERDAEGAAVGAP
jgi:ketopantoate reductase